MDAGDDLAANLRNYEMQLQQVLAALGDESGTGGDVTADHDELQRLKIDLEEVIKLTKELMTGGPSGKSGKSTASGSSTQHSYKAGDRVLAPWSEDGMYYEAVLEEVMSDGQCNVTFSSDLGATKEESEEEKPRKRRKGISEVCLVSLLKPVLNNDGSSKKTSNNRPQAAKGPKVLSRDDLKKKQQKRVSKQKELEEDREKEKNKWQQFNQFSKKGGSTKKKGLTSASGSKSRISIFASPEGVVGRVGVGTMGTSGKPMTPYVPSSSVGTATHQVALHHSSFQKKKHGSMSASKK